MKILSLDLATTTGWAHDGPNGGPVAGRYRLSDGARGHRFLSFNRWLYDFSADFDALAYEAPIFFGGVMKADTVMITVGLAAQAEMIAAARNIPVWPCSIGSVRKHFTGSARHKNPKSVVKARCRELGWTFVDDNAADALALWSFAKATHDPAVRMPLLAGAR